MEKENIHYTNGIEFALEQMLTQKNEFNKKKEEILIQQGEEAKKEFERGYYKALLYFVHASDHYQDNPKYIAEQAQRIEESHGEIIKNIFLTGLEYYRKHNEEKQSQRHI